MPVVNLQQGEDEDAAGNLIRVWEVTYQVPERGTQVTSLFPVATTTAADIEAWANNQTAEVNQIFAIP
jgi:hypothetical protein